MPRPCQICSDSANMRLAAEMLTAGASDQAIADRIGGISRMSVARHRKNHLEKPARAILEAANKGRDVRDERDQFVAAAEQGDVAAAFLSLERIAADLRRVQERLERTADAAETDRQPGAVAALSGQQLKATEVRAKLAGVGGYATPQTSKDSGTPFVLRIHFSDGRTTHIEGMPGRPDDPAFNTIATGPLSIGPASPAHGGMSHGEPSDDEAMFDEDV